MLAKATSGVTIDNQQTEMTFCYDLYIFTCRCFVIGTYFYVLQRDYSNNSII